MKKYLGCVNFGLALVCANLFAAEKPAAETSSDESVSFESSFLSAYVDTDGQRYHAKPVVQSELLVPLRGGFYVNILHSGQTNLRAGEGTSLESGLGWSGESGLGTAEVVVYYYDWIPLWNGKKNDLYELYAKFSKDFECDTYGKLSPFLQIELYKTTSGSDYEGGFRSRLGVEFWHRLFNSQLRSALSIIRDDGTFGELPAWVASWELSLDWEAGKSVGRAKVASVKFPLVTAYVPITPKDSRPKSLVGGAGIAFNF